MGVFSMLHIQEKTSTQNFQALAREGLWLLFSAFDSSSVDFSTLLNLFGGILVGQVLMLPPLCP